MATDAPQGPFEVFLSYARLDNHPADPAQGWVTALHRFIQSSARLPGGTAPRVFFDTKDICDDEDWRHRILDALRHSKVLLVCLSPNYFNSRNCRLEWEHFLQRQGPRAGGEGKTIQSVRFIELPGSLPEQNQAWLESVRRGNTIDLQPWFAQGAAALEQAPARAAAARAVAALVQRIRYARRELAREYGNLRAANEHFVGRQTQLRQLHEGVGVGRLGVITALHGLGGIGKTELAVQYANDYARSFPAGIWWINAAGHRDLRTCLASLIDDPRFPQPAVRSTDDAQRYAHVLHTLQTAVQRHQTADPDGGSQVLILLDNVDHLGLLGANQRVHVANMPWLSLFATTRDSAAEWSRADRLQVLALDALDPDDALALLREWQPGHAFTDAAAAGAAAELCALLGHFTLAIEQAAIYLGTEPGASVQGFLQRLQADGLQQLDTLAEHPELQASMQHRDKQLALVLAQTLPQPGTLERLLLDYAACWGSDAVPKPWIEDLIRQHHPEQLQAKGFTADPLAAAWAWLARRRLLTPAPLPELRRMHRLVRVHVLAMGSEARPRVAAQISFEAADLESRMYREAIPAWQVDALQAWATADGAEKNRLCASALLVLATYSAFARSVSPAAALARASLDIFEQLLLAKPTNAEAQRDMYVSLHRVGDIKVAQGDSVGALSAYQRMFEITKSLALTDPTNLQTQRDMAMSLNNVGQIKAWQGDAAGALRDYQHSLQIREKLALDNPGSAQAQRDVSASLDSIGEIKAAHGDGADALLAYERSLQIRETLALKDTTSALAQRDISVSLNKVGQIKAQKGDIVGALCAFQRCLQIREALASSNPGVALAHRDVMAASGNIGQIKAMQGDTAGALQAYQRSLQISEALALADPNSAEAQRDLSVSLISVGQINAEHGDTAAASLAYQRSLLISEALALADPSNALAQRDLVVSHGNILKLVTDFRAQVHHARQIDRVFTKLEASGAHISPADRQGWREIKKRLKDND